jgi:hypothetical protein
MRFFGVKNFHSPTGFTSNTLEGLNEKLDKIIEEKVNTPPSRSR